jgi:hypothetical protein
MRASFPGPAAAIGAGTRLVMPLAAVGLVGRPGRVNCPSRDSVGAAPGAQHDVVNVVCGGGGSGRAGSLLVQLDIPLR